MMQNLTAAPIITTVVLVRMISRARFLSFDYGSFLLQKLARPGQGRRLVLVAYRAMTSGKARYM